MIKQENKLIKQIVVVLLVATTLLFTFASCKNDTVQTLDVKGEEDLKKANIGVQLGTTGDLYASDYEKDGATVVKYNKGTDAVQALKKGKVDCVVIDEQPAKAFVKKNSDLSILENPLTEEEYAICVAKENTELLAQVNDMLAKLENDGTLDKIIGNYIGDETKGTYQYTSPQGTSRSNGTLVVATNAAFEPYEYVESGKIVGIDIDIAQAIADGLGMELKIEEMEFDSIISAVSSGKAQLGVSGMTVTEERLQNINFTTPYTTAKQVIIVRNGTSDSTALVSVEKFKNDFIVENRWQYIAKGLVTTLQISLFASIIGIILGFLIAVARVSCDKTGKFKLLNLLLRGYLTIIRGTPAMIQLLIIYYVIFATSAVDKVLVAIIAFGLNSSAYIAEIVRSGIMSIDEGQFEAGRSLGFSYSQTMTNFILPQAIKNVLPALGNEFIVLIKETSISGYIGIMDLTRGGDLIRSRTYDAFLPLIAVALVYLVIVVVLTSLLSKLEKRLKNDGK
ncbi:MAG: ABC transporter substrate-binding protein/permease [Acutalibacteraceae bacterium]|nr:ABC transporter substrate-binding protein/permease [Acutalibacteraceae bacterium]